MSFKNWATNGWLKSHKTSQQEVRQLLAMVDRDIDDAQKENVSADWRFGIAYNAALKLYTILLYAQGFRPEKNLAHYRTLMSLPLILGRMTRPTLMSAEPSGTLWSTATSME